MPIVTYGINHKSAPITVREQLAYSNEHATSALQELLRQPAVNEAVLLSTCNRTEIYSYTQDTNALPQWLYQQHKIDITPFSYSYQGIDAVRHLMRVASGLDSMALGEPQILGQIKAAYQLACASGTVGQQLQQLFPAAFAASKHVRSQTELGSNPISIAYAVTQLAKRIFTSLKNCSVLLIGAGATIELVATHLKSETIGSMTVANRTIEKATELAQQFQGHAIRIGDIPKYLSHADIVISATASQLPIIGKGMVETSLKQNKHRPIFMADLAVPRDIETEVGQLADVYLYNIDDLQGIIYQNMQNRQTAALQAEALIEIQAQHYMRQLRVVDASDIICRYRAHLEGLCESELNKALQQIAQGKSPAAVLNLMAHGLINKIMHNPTVKLRDAAYNGQIDKLILLKEFFEL